jgi:Flp pilus assembly protein CpaB
MRQLNISIVLGVIVAFLGASSVVAYGRTVDRRVHNGQRLETVLVATGTLAAGTPVSAVKDHVHATKMPAAYVVDGALTSLSDVSAGTAGQQVLVSAVTKGAQLTRSSFADPSVAGHLQPAAGHVAVAVETDLSPGVARYLTAGQLVDVFVTYADVHDKDGKPTFASSRTKLFISGAKVLAVSVAQPTVQQQKSTGSATTTMEQLQGKVIAVLELTPQDAERLVNAETLGTIYLGYTPHGGDTTGTGVIPDDVVRSNR